MGREGGYRTEEGVRCSLQTDRYKKKDRQTDTYTYADTKDIDTNRQIEKNVNRQSVRVKSPSSLPL